jgi:hypothetical protein
VLSPDQLADTTVECFLDTGDPDAADRSAVSLSPGDTATIPLLAAVNLTSGGATLTCTVPSTGPPVLANRIRMTAIQVDSLTFEP